MMTRTKFSGRCQLLASAALLAAVCSPATAQVQEEQPAPQENQSATDADQAEIVITAQKREEKILDIPQSVTVVGGDTLERQQATTFEEYLNLVPGLSLEQSEPGVGRLVLRGVNTGGVSSTVGIYIDETPFGSSSGQVNGAILAADFDTFDVARIEVLRGPQGTLYGASSLGGVLKFVTNTPQLGSFAARARAGVEFIDEGGMGYNVNGMVNVPLGSIAAFRGSGFYRKNSGWIDGTGSDATFLGLPSLGGEDINDSRLWGGRGSLLVKPIEPLTIRLTAIAQHIESDASSDVEVTPHNYDRVDGEFTQSRFFREPNELEYRLYNGTVEYDFGFANLLSSTSYGKNDQTFSDDLTQAFGTLVNFFLGPLNPGTPGFPLPQLTTEVIGLYQDQETDVRKFTQEVRLASPSNDRFEWMVGGYYTKERGKIDQSIPGVALATGEIFDNPLLGSLATALLKSRYRELAGFANVTWHVTDRFDLSAGGRYSKIKQFSVQSSAGILANGGSPPLEARSKESVFTYSLSPRFELNDNTAIYARVAKGYRPGGPNVIPPTAGGNVPRSYAADTLLSYEAGLKMDLGRGMALDIAAFHQKWKDIQLFTIIDNFGLNINGSTAVSNGIEGSLSVRPIPGMTASINGAYIDAHLTGATPPEVGGFDGDRLPYTPKLSFSLNGDYEWALSPAAMAFVGSSLRVVGPQKDNFIAGGIPQRHVPTYATLDLRTGVDFDRFTIEGFIRNVTNTRGVNSIATIEDALTGGNPLRDNALRAALTTPRTIGITVGTKF